MRIRNQVRFSHGSGWARTVISLAAFNVVWIVCVVERSGWGLFAVAWSLLPHFALVAADDRRGAARVLVAAAVLGTAADTVLERAGVLRFEGGPRLGPLCRLWITALWINFGATFHCCLAWTRRRPAFAALLGAVMAPLSYALAARMGAGDLEPRALPALAAAYAALTPLLAVLARPRTPSPSPRECAA